ncbi:putative RNA methyltransferase [Nocardia sp. NPDC088792]|uniref:putative RNA methyltransferase n=1 Tax=Nocardia sp. NPDC088792 TaxID=3364332 RepID=UPI0037F8B4FE
MPVPVSLDDPPGRRLTGTGFTGTGPTGASVNTRDPIGAAEPSPADGLLTCADLLACPECARPLTPEARTLRCPAGHTFDLAKQGYVSLLTGAATKMTGDTPAMLDARAAFQSAGHFAPLAEAITRTLTTALAAGRIDPAAEPRAHRPLPGRAESDSATRKSIAAGPADRASAMRATGIARPGGAVVATSAARLATALLAAQRSDDGASTSGAGHSGGTAVLEIGAGTGYYLAAVLDSLPRARGIALDVSKAAARRAARAHTRAGAVLADAWRGLPVRDGVMDAVVCVFAPRNAEEVARVLGRGGVFVVVTPTPRHLGEIVGPLGMVSVDAAKQDRLAESLGAWFEAVEQVAVEYSMSLTHADIANVAGMGPSAHHAARDRADRIAALPDLMPVTASVTVAVYRPRA